MANGTIKVVCCHLVPTPITNRTLPDRCIPSTVGLFLLKHMSGKSDEEVVMELLENPYRQSVCGLEAFATSKTIEASTLSRLRKRLGPKYVQEMEEAIYGVWKHQAFNRAKVKDGP
jgi:hypothetical protein